MGKDHAQYASMRGAFVMLFVARVRSGTAAWELRPLVSHETLLLNIELSLSTTATTRWSDLHQASEHSPCPFYTFQHFACVGSDHCTTAHSCCPWCAGHRTTDQSASSTSTGCGTVSALGPSSQQVSPADRSHVIFPCACVLLGGGTACPCNV